MNRVIKKTVSNVFALKIPRKCFCSQAVKVDASTNLLPSNEHEKKPIISQIIPEYDVAIVGGGMVGMALACFLACMPMTKQLSVAIIDSNPALSSGLCIKKEDPPDPRVSTVTPASISFLQEAGAWKYVEQNRHAYFKKMQEHEKKPIITTLYNNLQTPRNPHSPLRFLKILETHHQRFLHSHHDSPSQASFIQNLLKFRRDKPTEQIERALNLTGIHPDNNLVLQVLQRHRSDWKPAFIFFKWVSKTNNYTPSCEVYNEIINILGKMKCFEELHQVLDEMSQRKEFINEETFCILIRRFVAAHKLEEAINIFYRREEFGLDNELDLEAFRTLLMWMCRYKHIEEAETLFHRNLNKFGFCRDIKTWNVILNGWCVLGNTHEAKRLWKDIIAYKCKPDIFTYATFIKAMTKKGKLGTALKLFNGMWKEESCKPDVVICNCLIDGLCFKKRIPEALQVFHDMKERDCLPNVATYNSLIKHLCKIRRMEKVYELVEDMERRSGDCLPNGVTYSYLLQSLKAPEEVPAVLERMERNGCAMSDDICNLVLRLYMKWDDLDGLRKTWDEMERNGLGPDRRSYTIMIHGHYENGRTKDAMRYFREMTSKGIVLEPRTEKLVISMNGQLKERTEKQGVEIEASNV